MSAEVTGFAVPSGATGCLHPTQTGAKLWRSLASTELLAAASLANLCLIRVWAESTPYLGSTQIALLKHPHGLTHYAVLLLGLILLTGLIITVHRGTEGQGTGWRPVLRRTLQFGAFLVVANNLRLVGTKAGIDALAWTFWRRELGESAAIALAAASLFFALVLVRRKALMISSLLRSALLTMAPLIGLNLLALGTALWRVDAPLWADQPSARVGVPSGYPGARLVVLVFDEWDQRLTFEKRKPGLKLPNLDRIKGESVYFSQAYPPSNTTLHSLPSLTTGRQVRSVRVDSPRRFELSGIGGSEVDWAEAPNLFQRARAAGMRSAIAGWYLPYCRLFGSLCVSCKWWSSALAGFPEADSVPQTLAWQLNSMFNTSTTSLTGWTAEEASYRRLQEESEEEAIRVASEPEYDFVFLHLPTLHQPFLYDARTRSYDLRGSPIRGYWDAMAKADEITGRIEWAMRGRRTWERSLVVLTSDHGFRMADLLDGVRDPRVPFLVKLPETNNGEYVAARVETRRLMRLFDLAVSKCKVTADEVITVMNGQGRSE